MLTEIVTNLSINLFYLILFISFAIVIGNILISQLPYKHIKILSLPIAVLTITITYAIYIVNFQSIFIILIPFFLYYSLKFKWSKPELKQSFLESLQQIKLLSVPIILFYLINYIFSFKTTYFPLFEIPRDDLYYAQVSNFINEVNIESNRIGWYNRINDLGASQYHYFELYLNAFLARIFSLKPVTSYAFLLFPIFQTIFFTGLIFIRNKINNNKLKTLEIILIFLFSLIIPSVKFSSTFLPLLFLTYALYRNKIVLIIFASAILLTFNPIFIPLILPIVIIYLTQKRFVLKSNSKTSLKLIISLVLLYLSFFMTSKLLSGNITSLNVGLFNLNDFIDYYMDISHYKTLLHYWFNYILKLFKLLPFMFIYTIFLLIYLFREKSLFKQSSFFVFVIGLLLSIIGSGLLHFMNESAQIFQFCYYALVFTLLPFLTFFIQKENTLLKYVTFCVLLITFGLQHSKFNLKIITESRLGKYSKDYILNTYEIIGQKDKVAVIRFLKDENHYKDPEHFNPYNSYEGYYLGFKYNQYYLHTFNMHYIPYKASLHDYHNYNRSKILPQVYDYNYFQQFNTKTDEELLVQFLIDHQNVNYAIIENGANTPSNLHQFVDAKITDPKSKEIFIKLIQINE